MGQASNVPAGSGFFHHLPRRGNDSPTPNDYIESHRDTGVAFTLSDQRMRCPFCKADNDRVIDSRASDEGASIRRRRECLHCKRRFTTYERVEEMVLKVVKRGGAREPFTREKIRKGIERACWKRPISDTQIESLVAAIELEITNAYETEIGSKEIGELVMERLAKLDEVAYLRFASVYGRFKDVRDFVQAVQPMLKNHKEGKG